ncbi:uncharacterized protein CDAR_4351 [Caerostris darwini]|uniref:Uncharacterized protein n=1 Tax=Caerostris darwini TaxID=1538125 RepID=A0AAV4VAA0_9ARAC|nr:uncharacterized protein CDAR_4351 [Caerostris darwini]
MMNKKFYVWNILLILSVSLVLAEDENSMLISNATRDADQDQAENEEMIFSSPVSEDITEPIGMPKPTKPKSHHHSKQKDHLENVQSHRKPVYAPVSQPCNSYSCRGGYGRPDRGYQPWQTRGNRFVPYPQSFDESRRGPYQGQDNYYDDYYAPREPEYGYRQRGGFNYPQGRYGNYGGYAYGRGYFG